MEETSAEEILNQYKTPHAQDEGESLVTCEIEEEK